MAITIEVEPLMGWLTSRDFTNGRFGEPEYPPHPDRLFSALVSAWAVAGGKVTEKNALKALEGHAPTIIYPPLVSTSKTNLFVKVNNIKPQEDKEDKKEGQLGQKYQPLALPEYRVGASKVAMRIHPREGTLLYVFSDVDSEHAEALHGMARRIGYLGGTESLVRMVVHKGCPNIPGSTPEDQDETRMKIPESHLIKTPVTHTDHHLRRKTERLRVPQNGRLEILTNHHQSISVLPPKKRGRKFTPVPQSATTLYITSSSEPEPMSTPMAGSWLAFRRAPSPNGSQGRSLSSSMSMIVSKQIRRTITKYLIENKMPVPPALIGHDGDDRGPRHGHNIAIQPLLDVGHAHASGRIVGFTIIMPDGLSIEDRHSIASALGNLALGDDGAITIPLQHRTDVEESLLSWKVTSVTTALSLPRVFTAERWTRASRDWATVTPIITDRMPKTRRHLSKEIVRSCLLAGLPQPECVILLEAPAITGAPHAGVFGGRNRRHDRKNIMNNRALQRPIVHAMIRFPVPIIGPVIIGSGRYNGMGFCTPINDFPANALMEGVEHDTTDDR